MYKQTTSSVKKFFVQLSVKKIVLRFYLNMKDHIIIDFHEKWATVNRTSYYSAMV